LAGLGGLVLLTALGAAPAAAGGVIRYVDDDGLAGAASCDGTRVVPRKVNAAVTAANPGDTIRVCPGTYTRYVRIAKAGITIVGTPARGATLRAPVKRPSPNLILVTADDVTLRGLRILAPAGTITGDECDVQWTITAIRAEGTSDLTIQNNLIEGDGTTESRDCGLEFGIETFGASGVIASNLVRNFVNTGLTVFDSEGLQVTRNTIRYVHPGPARTTLTQGIWAYGGSVTIADNRIETAAGTANQMSLGITVDFGTDATVQDNTVVRAKTALAITGTADGVVQDNVLKDGSEDGILVTLAKNAPTSPSVIVRRNVVTGFGGSGIRSSGSSGLAIRYNDFSDNAGIDCVDNNSPSQHTWVGNKSSDISDPVGICSPDNPGPG
jgi:nitrous oxidase accessory protein NosD